MAEKLYLEGLVLNNGTLRLPLISSALLFVSKYCSAQHFTYYIVSPEDTQKHENYVNVSTKLIDGLNVECLKENELPDLVNSCILPVTVTEETSIIRSGLCGTVRYIIHSTHQQNPGGNYIDLLGFRNGSLRMCAEVSGWTKLCEIELPATVTRLLKDIRGIDKKNEKEIEIPVDLLKFEKNFDQPPKLHNDHKIKKHVLVQNREDVLNPETGLQFLESVRRDSADYLYERDVTLNHGIRRYQIYKNVSNNLYLKSDKKYARDRVPKYKPKDKERPITLPVKKTHEERAELRKEKKKRKLARKEAKRLAELAEETEKLTLNQNGSNKCDEMKVGNGDISDCHVSDINGSDRQDSYTKEEIINSFKTLSVLDVNFVHVYSEGLEMTVADLILFVYLFVIMEELNFQLEMLKELLPNVCSWFNHMLSLPRVNVTCQSSGLIWNKGRDVKCNIMFTMPKQDVTVDEDMELHQRHRSDVRAIKPEVNEILQLVKNSNISIKIGNHPCGDDVSINWNDLPNNAHPQEGAVPRKRIERKCQQLENLVTAVIKLSKSGNSVFIGSFVKSSPTKCNNSLDS